jgi:hypothetical protein
VAHLKINSNYYEYWHHFMKDADVTTGMSSNWSINFMMLQHQDSTEHKEKLQIIPCP